MASCATRHPLGDRSDGSSGALQPPQQLRVRRCTRAAARACTSHGTHAAVSLPRRSLAGVRVPRRQVEAGAADPSPPCLSRRGCRLVRAQRQEQARADGRTDARSDGHVESALDGTGATQRTIPSIPTALIASPTLPVHRRRSEAAPAGREQLHIARARQRARASWPDPTTGQQTVWRRAMTSPMLTKRRHSWSDRPVG